MDFMQDDDHGAKVMFGATREDPMNQEAGTVQTPVSTANRSWPPAELI